MPSCAASKSYYRVFKIPEPLHRDAPVLRPAVVERDLARRVRTPLRLRRRRHDADDRPHRGLHDGELHRPHRRHLRAQVRAAIPAHLQEREEPHEDLQVLLDRRRRRRQDRARRRRRRRHQLHVCVLQGAVEPKPEVFQRQAADHFDAG